MRIAGGESLSRLVVHRPRSAGEQTYLAIELENVRITSYSISAVEDIPIESITFHYEKIDVKDGPILKGKKVLEN